MRAEPPRRTFEPGTVIDGKYRVVRMIGEGGMGAVWEVRDPDDARRALKVVLDAGNPIVLKRFVREANAALSLSSESATRVYATGTLDDGSPYLVMELLEGQDLLEHLDDVGRLTPDQAIAVTIQICDALEEAHELGMVHRDVKPPNIYLRTLPDGSLRAKLLDFGISKPALTDVAPVTQLTQMGTILGSPHYMSPEQLVSSSDVDGRADIWSLGATLYEMLAGHGPFAGDTVAEVVSAVLRDPPHPLRERHPEVSAELEGVVLRCLEKSQEQRYATISELADALRLLAPPPESMAPSSRHAEIASPPSSRSAPVAPMSVGAKPNIPVAPPSNRKWFLLAVPVLLVGILVGVLLLLGGGSDDGKEFEPGAPSGADLELEEGVRERVSAQIRSAFGKLVARKHEAAIKLASAAEADLMGKGLAPPESQSRLAQDAAYIQARAIEETVMGMVKEAGKDDEPAPLIVDVKEYLERHADDAKRAAAWNRATAGCKASRPVFTQVAILSLWRAYGERLSANKKKVADNYARTLERQTRTRVDELLHPTSGLAESCHAALEAARKDL